MAALPIEIRDATVADLHDLIDLMLSDAGETANAATLVSQLQCERLDRQERGDVWFLVAESKGDIVGQLVLRWPGHPDRLGRRAWKDVADIEDIRVYPSYRGRGIGSEMLNHVEWMCTREGVDQIGTCVEPKAASDAVEWFRRRDYEIRVPDDHAPVSPSDGDGLDGEAREWIVMMKDL